MLFTMVNKYCKFLVTFALLSSGMIYSQGEITTPEGTFIESVPAGTTDFSSILMRANMSRNTTINFTSSDPAAIQAIQQQAAQMGIKVNVISPNNSTTSSPPSTDPTSPQTSVSTQDQTQVSTPEVTSAVPSINLDQARQSVIDRINAFRQTKGLAPLQRWVEGESCADDQAKNDALSGGMHKNFGACQEAGQMTCPGWNSIESVNSDCLQQMWDEGPGTGMEHIHYNIMTSETYTKVAVGIFQMSNGKFWIDINFK